MKREQSLSTISRCAVIASLLEVSAYPKPGNVHRLRDFEDTKFEHFLAGNVALGPTFRKAAGRGYDLSKNSISWMDLRIGELIFEASSQMLKWQSGGNVNLGIILLFVPITIAAGYVIENDGILIEDIRGILRKIVRRTTSNDAVLVYNSIKKCMSEKTLGEVGEFDVRDEKAVNTIVKKGLTLLDVFGLCKQRDLICSEWCSDFDITFNHSYPYLKMQIFGERSINSATINTFLYILSEYSDSLIQRKRGLAAAKNVSEEAKKIIEAGGYDTEDGREMIWNFDEKLHKAEGLLNPGTTADLTATSLYLLLLEGWRP